MCSCIVLQFRKQLDDISSKNSYLNQQNTDLKHKLTTLEYKTKEQKEKISDSKRDKEEIKHKCEEQRAEIEKIKVPPRNHNSPKSGPKINVTLINSTFYSY